MLIYMIIPIIIFVIGMILFPRRFNVIEFLIGLAVTFITVLSIYYIQKSNVQRDVEFNSYLVNEARYYEYYSTWVHKTCSYTTCTGSGKTRICTTHYYDCSYCDENPERFELIDSGGNKFDITRSEYESYVKLWNSKPPTFVELDRRIRYHGSCGKDGDMYKVNWNGDWKRSMTSTRMVEYTNPLLLNTSAFSYEDVQQDSMSKLMIRDYPAIRNYYQPSVQYLGNTKRDLSYVTKQLDYFNGKNGKKLKCKVFLYIFENQPLSQGFLQEKVFKGGNQNEVIITLSVDSKGFINWVYCFTWNKDKRLAIDPREETANLKHINNLQKLYPILEDEVTRIFKWRNFKQEFDYITYSPTSSQVTGIIVIASIVSLICTIIFIRNDYDSDDIKI